MVERFTDLLGNRYKAEVLKFLKDNPDDFFTINEISNKTSGSNPSVKGFLEDLDDLGLVKFRKKGGSYLIEYNPTSRYDEAVKSIFKVEIEDLWKQAERFATDLVHHSDRELARNVHSVVLYGSVARGTADSNSDIDVLVLVKDKVKSESIMEIALEIAKRRSGTENEIVPTVESTEEFHDNFHEGNRFEQNVHREGEILIGDNWRGFL